MGNGTVVITDEHLRVARSFGACVDAFKRYHAGDSVADVIQADLEWCEVSLPEELLRRTRRQLGREHGVPTCVALSLYVTSGYGSGDGSG